MVAAALAAEEPGDRGGPLVALALREGVSEPLAADGVDLAEVVVGQVDEDALLETQPGRRHAGGDVLPGVQGHRAITAPLTAAGAVVGPALRPGLGAVDDGLPVPVRDEGDRLGTVVDRAGDGAGGRPHDGTDDAGGLLGDDRLLSDLLLVLEELHQAGELTREVAHPGLEGVDAGLVLVQLRPDGGGRRGTSRGGRLGRRRTGVRTGLGPLSGRRGDVLVGVGHGINTLSKALFRSLGIQKSCYLSHSKRTSLCRREAAVD